MSKTKGRKKMGYVILVIILVTFVASIIAIWAVSTHSRELDSLPETDEKVEVVGKRVRQYGSSGKNTYTVSYTYIVSFKFSDGAIKEFKVDRKSYRGAQKSTPPSSQHDFFTEGDTGILTYKEIENIEKRVKHEDMRYDSRRFISFENDLEYGGLIIEAPYKQEFTIWNVLKGLIITLVILFSFLAGIVLFLRLHKR